MPREMPHVNMCDVNECAYNTDNKCHAIAITVGDSDSPMCDTFFNNSKKGGSSDIIGGVGACKVSKCQHNENFECAATEIRVGHQGSSAICNTYHSR